MSKGTRAKITQRFLEGWQAAPEEERRKIRKLLGSHMAKLSYKESMADQEPSEEYGAVYSAWHLLWDLGLNDPLLKVIEKKRKKVSK
jgi:hypothetical protein